MLNIILIIFTLLFILTISFIVIKYILNPLFFSPKLSYNEILEILEKKECLYVNHSYHKIEKNDFNIDEIFNNYSEYLIKGESIIDKSIKIFSVKIKVSNSFFKNREIIITEVKV